MAKQDLTGTGIPEELLFVSDEEEEPGNVQAQEAKRVLTPELKPQTNSKRQGAHMTCSSIKNKKGKVSLSGNAAAAVATQYFTQEAAKTLEDNKKTRIKNLEEKSTNDLEEFRAQLEAELEEKVSKKRRELAKKLVKETEEIKKEGSGEAD